MPLEPMAEGVGWPIPGALELLLGVAAAQPWAVIGSKREKWLVDQPGGRN
jgi:hypothetical protein